MFGTHDYSLSIDRQGMRIRVERSSGVFRYIRETEGKRVEKVLSSPYARILLHPVEPVNLPKKLTRLLEIEFDPVVMGPNSEKTFYLKFPIEIGIFLEEDGMRDVIDLVSIAPPKFSLYGNPRSGVITRYFRSNTYFDIPEVEPCLEGVLKLTVKNPLRENVEVSRVVLEGHSMMLYFGRFASMIAYLQIVNSQTGETYFMDEPLELGMERAIKLYKVRRMPVAGLERAIMIGGIEHSVFTMEWGLT
ncbi:MAG: DUF432 domain-containing protein [Methanomicrobiales archaeon]|nr:DUF432 domain-containing protein [Methanomicrobiales archaeon]